LNDIAHALHSGDYQAHRERIAEKTSDDVTPGQLKVMKDIADRIREAAMNPRPGMEDIKRAYGAVLLPLHGESSPVPIRIAMSDCVPSRRIGNS
jgi:hypothetical protein